MIELKVALVVAIAVTVVVLIALFLIIILIAIKVRKTVSKKANPEINYKSTGLAQSQEIESGDASVFHAEPKSKLPGESKADESVFNTEPQSGHFVEIQADESLFEIVTSTVPQTNETLITAPENRYKNLPQDSMLKRHYLTNLHAMIESLKFPRPTDAALSRHYDAMIITEMEECLSNEAIMERLICNYEEHKKTLAQQIRKPQAIPEPLIEPIKVDINQEKPKLPEDSMLRRHYLTHLRTLVESRMPPRPTDSILRRHYDSMIENEVKNLL